jgi:hypothetical protein
MEIQFDLVSEDHLLIQKYVGAIDRKFLLGFLQYLSSEFNLTNINKILIDVRECNPVFDNNDISLISNFRKENIKLANNVLTVILAQSPKTTVFSIIYNALTQNTNNTYEVCSTTEKAISFLNLDYATDEMEMKIELLKNKFP